jgi:ERCC4-related helicase
VLVCSSVAEEGIDLQKQCNTVIHYDLEWNPAKVEQREGRVDRLGGSDEVLVEFKRLAKTYDERIYNRFNARRIWMDLYLCNKWIEEGNSAEEDSDEEHDAPLGTSNDVTWLAKYRLDLRPRQDSISQTA